MLRYHGVLSANAKVRAEVIPKKPVKAEEQQPLFMPDEEGHLAPPPEPSRHPWPWLLKRVFAVDITAYPKCTGRMRVIEVAKDGENAARVLSELGISARALVSSDSNGSYAELEGANIHAGVAIDGRDRKRLRAIAARSKRCTSTSSRAVLSEQPEASSASAPSERAHRRTDGTPVSKQRIISMTHDILRMIPRVSATLLLTLALAGCATTANTTRTVASNSAPPATCVDENTLRTYAPTSTCAEGTCTYTPTDTPCLFGCTAGRCAAEGPTFEAYFKASNTGVDDLFGASISLSGDLLAVGSQEDSAATSVNGDQNNDSATDSGAVYVFHRNATGAWTQEAYLKASNTDADDQFGWSVSLSGDLLAVGAPGRLGGHWCERRPGQ